MANPFFLKIVGLALIITGWAIRYKINQRRFYRRGPAGLEWFSSYRRAVLTRFIEGLAGILGKLLIFFGILSLLAGFIRR